MVEELEATKQISFLEGKARDAIQQINVGRKRIFAFKAHHWGLFTPIAAVGGSRVAKELNTMLDLGELEKPLLFKDVDGSRAPLPELIDTPSELLGFVLAGGAFLFLALLHNAREKMARSKGESIES